MIKTKTNCPDCGNAPTSHRAHKMRVVFRTASMPLLLRTRSIEGFFEQYINRITNRVVPSLFRFLAKLHLGQIVCELDERMNMRERVFWDEGVRRGIVLWAYRMFPKGNTFTVATYAGKTIVYDTIPHPNGVSSYGSYWMDDKNMCHQIFAQYGIPMAKGRAVFYYRDAKRILHSIHGPVIVKPSRGSRSRHTTTHIESEAELRRAFIKAKQLSPLVIVEEELDGFVYRGTVIGGKVIGILRREPALVVGDGIHTIAELIALENKNPKRGGPIFHTIEIQSEEYDKELARQGMSLMSVPEKNVNITLTQKASRGLGGGATDVTDKSHPDNVLLLEHVAKILEDQLVGVDFIIHDITRSWKEQRRAGIIECNSLPFIDLHLFPMVGKPRNTPGALWDLIFPQEQT